MRPVKKLLHITSLLFCFSVLSSAQTKSDILDEKKPNLQFLESLIKHKTDSFRLRNGVPVTMNDSSLYLAAINHSKYLIENFASGHDQFRKRKTQFPQLRANYFGATGIFVDENIAQGSIEKASLLKEGENVAGHTLKTYEQIANEVLREWEYSDISLSKLLSATYLLTGIAIDVDVVSYEYRAVQVLGKIPAVYTARNCRDMFPFTPAYNDSLCLVFNISRKKSAQNHTKHAWDLRPLEDQNVKKTIEYQVDKFDEITISSRKGKAKIYFDSFNSLASLLSGAKDGLAVEVIPFEQYGCNTETYYTSSKARNGKCIFNGIVLPPVYSKDIFKINNATGAVPVDIEVDLGVIPEKYLGGKYEVNVWLIKNNELVMPLKQASVCGIFPKFTPKKISYDDNLNDAKYIPEMKGDTLRLRIYFKQNQIEPEKKDVKEFLDYLKREGKIIVEANIDAYASIEGLPEVNVRLFTKRAESFLTIFQTLQSSDIKAKVTTTENWQLFYEQIKKTDLVYLADKDSASVRLFVNDTANLPRLEQWLAAQRYTDIYMVAAPDFSIENLIRMGFEEYKKLSDTLPLLVKDADRNKEFLFRVTTQMSNILKFIYLQYTKGFVKYPELNKLIVRDGDEYALPRYNELMFRFIYAKADRKIYEYDFCEEMVKLYKFKIMPASYYYNLGALVINYVADPYFLETVTLKRFGEAQGKFSEKDGLPEENMDQLKLFFHFKNSEEQKQANNIRKAKSSLSFLKNYCKNSKSADDSLVVEVANLLILFDKEKWAGEILEQRISQKTENNQLISLFLKLKFNEVADPVTSDYFNDLLEASQKMSEVNWCNLFMGDCNLRFQLFDYEPLWKLYCKKCVK